MHVHLAMRGGRTDGAPWCRSDPSVAAADTETAIVSDDEDTVTCPTCRAFIRRTRNLLSPPARVIDWFGEG